MKKSAVPGLVNGGEVEELKKQNLELDTKHKTCQNTLDKVTAFKKADDLLNRKWLIEPTSYIKYILEFY